jgi:hypothetical protein
MAEAFYLIFEKVVPSYGGKSAGDSHTGHRQKSEPACLPARPKIF